MHVVPASGVAVRFLLSRRHPGRSLIALGHGEERDQGDDAAAEDVAGAGDAEPQAAVRVWLFWDMKSPIEAPGGRVRTYPQAMAEATWTRLHARAGRRRQ
jgi:hypothetical protein